MELAINILKVYNPSKINSFSKYLLDVIHEQNIKSKLSMVKKGEDSFWYLSIGYGATISRTSLLNILVYGIN